MEVGELFANFGILFKVGKWIADFKLWLWYWNWKEVNKLNADFRLFIVSIGFVDFKVFGGRTGLG